MYSKTETIEKPYSAAEKRELKKLFAELRKAGQSKSVQEYLREVKASLKA